MVAAKYTYTILAREFGGSVHEWQDRSLSDIEFHIMVLETEQQKRKIQNNEMDVLKQVQQQFQR